MTSVRRSRTAGVCCVRSAIVFVLAVALPLSAAEAPLFRAAAMIPTIFGQPTGISTPDLNGDGHADVVITHYESAALSVFLGAGDGTLTPMPMASAGGRAINILTGDVDGDQNIDVIVVQEESDNLWFVRGRGDGTFDAPRGPLVVGHDPIALAAGDFNEDGKLDLAVAFTAEGSGSVSTLLGNGDGTFGEPQTVGVPDFGVAVAVGDFNSDQHLDVVCSYSQTSVAVLLGHGDGSFVGPREVPAVSRATVIRVADIDADGNPDIVIAHAGANVVSVTRGRGDGTFDAPQPFDVGTAPITVSVADLNGDGLVDLASLNALTGDVSVLLGTGRGEFAAARSFVTGADPRAMELLRLDGDAFVDVAVMNNVEPTPQLAVLLGAPGGMLQAVENLHLGSAATAVISADVNNDAVADLLFAVPSERRVAVFLAAPTGRFTAAGGSGALDLAVNRLASGDFDRDGTVDVVSFATTSRDLVVSRGRGDGSFDEPRRHSLDAGGALSGLVVADVNEDGWEDIVVTRGGNALAVLLNDTRGGFAAPANQDVTASLSVPVAGDFNRDGHTDLAGINNQQGSVQVLVGDGAGGFSPGRAVPVSRQLIALDVADLNGDGFDDLAVTDALARAVRVLVGDGAGGFAPFETLPTDDLPFALLAHDVDGDGAADLTAANQGTSTLSVLLHDDAGGFAPQQEVGVGVRPTALATGDFDDDGRYDLVTVSSGADTCSIVSNVGARAASRGDGNGDGRRSAADIVAAALETTDGDGSHPEDIGRSFPASAGVDANGDGTITPQDVSATVRRLFRD